MVMTLLEGDIFRYYAELVEQVSIPVMIQDVSGVVGSNMSADLLVNMHVKLGIEYVKRESISAGPKITQLVSMSDGRLKIFGGWGGVHLHDTLRRGIVGFMPGCDLPELFVEIWRRHQAGQTQAARDLKR